MWLLCEPVCIGLAIGAAVSVWAWAACGRTAIGATAIKAPRPIARYLLIIAVPLEASLATLVSRTMSICAFDAELEMNVGFGGRAPTSAAEYAAPAGGRRGQITGRPNTRASGDLHISASCGGFAAVTTCGATRTLSSPVA